MRNSIVAIIVVSMIILISSISYFRPFSSVVEPEITPVEHVSLYHYFSGALGGGVEETVNIINGYSDQEKIIASALDHEAFKSLIISNLAKGDPPELFTYWAGTKTQELVAQGYLEPLDDVWQTYSIGSRLSSSLVETAAVYEGHKYFLPLDQHIVVFFYNVAVFEQFEIQPPEHFSELVSAAALLKGRGVTPFALGAVERWPAQFWFDYLLLRTAGPGYRDSLMQGEARYLDPQVVSVYKQWAELIRRGFFNTDANALDWAAAVRKVCTGEAAMTLMGSWAIQEFTGDACNAQGKRDFDFFAFPRIKENISNTSIGPVDGLVVTKKSANRELAKKLLPRFLDTSPQQAFSRGSGAFATSLDVPKSHYSPLKQRLFQHIQRSDSWAFAYDLSTSPSIADFGLDSFTELLAFPDQYLEILANLDQQAQHYHAINSQ